MNFLCAKTIEDILMKRESKQIEQALIRYAVFLRDKLKVAYATRNLYLASPLSFYSLNDVTLNKKKIQRYLGETTRAHKDRAYTTEEIAAILGCADARLRSIVLLLGSCGCRVGALPQLKVSNLVPIPDYNIYQVTIYENAQEEYITYTTPECKYAIVGYLDYRRRFGERVTPDSPLFREEFDINDHLQAANPHALLKGGFETLLSKALQKSGIIQVEHETETKKSTGRVRKPVSRFNGFRKFFNTNLVRAKVNPAVKEMLMGHSLPIRLDVNYYRPGQDEILQEYLKAVDLLTINEENRLKREVFELRQKSDRFETIEEKIHKLSEKLGLDW
jgi:integrase